MRHLTIEECGLIYGGFGWDGKKENDPPKPEQKPNKDETEQRLRELEEYRREKECEAEWSNRGFWVGTGFALGAWAYAEVQTVGAATLAVEALPVAVAGAAGTGELLGGKLGELVCPTTK